jgi:hypothetical protein
LQPVPRAGPMTAIAGVVSPSVAGPAAAAPPLAAPAAPVVEASAPVSAPAPAPAAVEPPEPPQERGRGFFGRIFGIFGGGSDDDESDPR